MRARLLLSALAATSVALALPGEAATPAPATPQVTDPSGDANGISTAKANSNQATPAGNQAYADVVSVLWQPVKTTVTKTVKRKKVTTTTVTGFTVTTTFSAPPSPPSGTAVVYRMLSTNNCGTFFGVVYYSTAGSDPAQPQSAVRDDCSGTTRLTKIDLPVIAGNTMTWNVPLTAIPADLKFAPGKKLTDLRFEVRELEDFHGQKVPDGVPSVGGATGLAAGVLDDGTSTATFTLG